ncbi:hypothetical protein [Nocardia terpenica]|uniref:hypothetical protein n=1 Tax=Nocardia terpenica TaxID=455432 RepID=UPI0012FD0762|nr:hypothetical protein [Nocardia terpenica]
MVIGADPPDTPTPRQDRDKVRINANFPVRLAYWRGNASALHRELLDREQEGGVPAPSLATLHRAIRQDVSPGDLVGPAERKRARCKFDVYLRRLATYRNEMWEPIMSRLRCT